MRSLSARIIAVQVLFLTIALMSIGVTLLVSWELEGGAAAINDAGSLRMRAYRLAYMLAGSPGGLAEDARAAVAADVRQFDAVLDTLKRGDPARPLFLPADRRIDELMAVIDRDWGKLRATAGRAVAGASSVVAASDVAARSQSIVHWRRAGDVDSPMHACSNFGLVSMTAVPVRAQDATIGVLNLFFRRERELDADERQLLETLGRHLGVAVENARLVAREKEMAVSEERNLLAQQLHDSIAQSLAFLKMQVGMLDGAMRRSDRKAESAAAAEIATGVRECYADVRELLVHFRTRTSDEDIGRALKVTLRKFEQQTGIEASFAESGAAMPVPAEERVQVLHIVQEALSNVRKHAGASKVTLTVLRGPVYSFEVRDDGCGFESGATASEMHVGLSIMRERARRAGASLCVQSRAGGGTNVKLTLPVAPADEPREFAREGVSA